MKGQCCSKTEGLGTTYAELIYIDLNSGKHLVCLNLNPWMGLFRFSSASMDCGYVLLCFEIKKQLEVIFFKLTYQPKCCKESVNSSSADYFCSVFNLLPSVTFFCRLCCVCIHFFFFFKCLQIKPHSNVIKYAPGWYI